MKERPGCFPELGYLTFVMSSVSARYKNRYPKSGAGNSCLGRALKKSNENVLVRLAISFRVIIENWIFQDCRWKPSDQELKGAMGKHLINIDFIIWQRSARLVS